VVAAAFAAAATGIEPDAPESTLRCLVALARAYPSRVAITLGARGVAVLDDRAAPVILAPPRVQAIDSSAAGDIFHGAFVWALLSGRSYLPAVRVAMRTAALSVTRPGGRSSIPERELALDFSPEWWPEEVGLR
jgi:ribokinase